jgi:hypothetical protein
MAVNTSSPGEADLAMLSGANETADNNKNTIDLARKLIRRDFTRIYPFYMKFSPQYKLMGGLFFIAPAVKYPAPAMPVI